jgi:hypothetical protein
MGCYCNKNASNHVVRNNKLDLMELNKLNKSLLLSNHVDIMNNLHKNYYFSIKLKSHWAHILDFLNYKELKEAGKLNK